MVGLRLLPGAKNPPLRQNSGAPFRRLADAILPDMAPLGSTVVFGAGNLGRRVARAVKSELFCDNNASLWGTFIDDVPVESPAAAVRSFPDATFVVAIWNPSRTESMLDRIGHLRSLGAQQVIPFNDLHPNHGDVLLPNLFWQRPDYYARQAENISAGRSLFDTPGQQEFDRQMRLRRNDYSGQSIDKGIQYFPHDLFHLSEEEVFIDCGAYDGDTIAEFRRQTGDRFKQIIAFEPDVSNLRPLAEAAGGDDRIAIQPNATGARRETLRFTAAGTGSHVSEAGTCEVQCVTLDEALQDVAPTYIKLDIEGSERDTLEGACETILRHRPKLAVCLYHVPDHLWSIPLRLRELLPDFRITLRTYNADGFDCVCYCIPR